MVHINNLPTRTVMFRSFVRLRLPTVLLVWPLLIVFWPLGDILRKWGGLNQPVYALQLLSPFLLTFYLWKKQALRLQSSIVVPCFIITVTTGLIALYYSLSEYSITYLLVWLLSLSALIGPPLLLCTTIQGHLLPNVQNKSNANRLIVLVSVLMLANNLLSVAQSVLGKSHILSAGAGGALDAQIGTNTDIELRAPGLFTFATGNATFSMVCFIFLFASLGFIASRWANFLRLLALASLPVALVRSVSRLFLFGLLVVSFPYAGLLTRGRIILAGLIFLGASLLMLEFFPSLQTLVGEGYMNFERRLTDGGGLYEGIIARFFNSLTSDAGGSDVRLTDNLLAWFESNSLGSLLGYGIGYSSPLFRFFQGLQSTAYGELEFAGKQFLLGESMYTSLLVDLGLINFLIYLWLVLNSITMFLRKFPLIPLVPSRAYIHSSFLALLLAFTAPYYRPANLLFFSSTILTPFVCKILFDPPPFKGWQAED